MNTMEVNLKRKNPLAKMTEIKLAWPSTFDLFNFASVKQVDENLDLIRPDQYKIEELFQRQIYSIFGFNGDINGYSFSFINPIGNSQIELSELLDEYHQSLFVEISNVAIGNMLGILNKKHGLLSYLYSPIVINSATNKSNKDAFKNQKYETTFVNCLTTHQLDLVKYQVFYQGMNHELSIYTAFQIKEKMIEN